MNDTKTWLCGAVAAFAVLGALRPARAADPAVELRAFAVDRNASPTATTTLEIVIERWSTDAEEASLRSNLVEKGGDEIAKTLRDLDRVGYIRTTGNLGWDLHFARQYPAAGGGRRIVFGTDRPMRFWELWNRPRSADYTLMLGEVKIGPDGTGQGTFFSAARVEWNPGTKSLEVENYSLEPVQLTQVKVEK